TESSDRSDKILPQAAAMAGAIGRVYLVLTVLCIIAYMLAGMTAFDAINHAMTTVSTGGYSTYDASFGHFADLPAAEWVAMVFMLAGSIGFTHYVVLMRGRFSRLTGDPQVRILFAIALVAPALLVFAQQVSDKDVSLGLAIREAFFHAISVISTTGYASTDYSAWSPMAVGIFFLLYFTGGCTGSTAGSVKMFRWYVLSISMRRLLTFMISPKRVMILSYRGRPVDVELQVSVMLFFFAFMLTVLIITLVLSVEGYDLMTCLSASASAVSNVGPGLGPIVGPAGNYAPLSDVSKIALAFGMLLGRLEIFTVLVLFTTAFWRR
ncbi:MAG: TrkH family potassium uptake protein, partial [Alphaproteobacteria bacterium]